MGISVTEREVPTHHREQNYTTAPEVGLHWTVHCLSFYNLRSCIARRTTERFEGFSLDVLFAESEIDDLELIVLIN